MNIGFKTGKTEIVEHKCMTDHCFGSRNPTVKIQYLSSKVSHVFDDPLDIDQKLYVSPHPSM